MPFSRLALTDVNYRNLNYRHMDQHPSQDLTWPRNQSRNPHIRPLLGAVNRLY